MVTVIDPIEHHTQRIQIQCDIGDAGQIEKLRGREGTDIILGDTCIFQILQRNQTQVTQHKFTGRNQENVIGLQVCK